MDKHERLCALLPSLDETYDYHSLSPTETAALNEALRDGFGDTDRFNSEPFPLPLSVRHKQGPLQHSVYIHGVSNLETQLKEYDMDERTEYEFWHGPYGEDSDTPPPAEGFPLNFNIERISIYFRNQVERYRKRIINENPDAYSDGAEEDDLRMIDELGFSRLYEKPWYELHAVLLLYMIGESSKYLAKHPGLVSLIIVGHAGQLGRLVEQYTWRLQYERAAKAGAGVRQAASAGGKAKAAGHKAERAIWQRAAADIWARRPELSKHAVAELIREKFG